MSGTHACMSATKRGSSTSARVSEVRTSWRKSAPIRVWRGDLENRCGPRGSLRVRIPHPPRGEGSLPSYGFFSGTIRNTPPFFSAMLRSSGMSIPMRPNVMVCVLTRA